MKIVIAVDSFKDSMTASTATRAIASGIVKITKNVEIVSCPIADGGEGTVDTFLDAIDGQKQYASVTGPLGELRKASWALFPDKKLAVIELAQAAGLQLVSESKRNPLKTTTYGVGELIRIALDANVNRIVIGIGGSATNDGGTGLAQALGVHFKGVGIPITGGVLKDVKSIDRSSIDPRINTVQIDVGCDVKNVLTGTEGAAQFYAAQKGATPEQVEFLDKGLEHLSAMLPEFDPDYPGAGAAGGVGWGLMAFCNAKLHKGIELILDVLNFDKIIKDADLIITGEGRMDYQSLQWKAPFGVAEYAMDKGIPVIALCGDHNIDQTVVKEHGIQACHSICNDLNIQVKQAIEDGENLLEKLTVKMLTNYITL